MEMLAEAVVVFFAAGILALGVAILVMWALLNPGWTIGIAVATVLAALVHDRIEKDKRESQ